MGSIFVVLLGIASFVFHVVFCTDCGVTNNTKIDCGNTRTTENDCLKDGCCWVPAPGQPWCYYPRGAKNCFFIDRETSIPPFNSTEIGLMKSYFLKNINIEGKGGVVAAPDHDTPGGSYYYHWERDAALSMRTLMTISKTPDEYMDYMKSYVQWVLRVQNEPDPHHQDVRTEPKYILPNGSVLLKDWCRPQTDGPALRATTLIIFANYLIKSGESDYVKKYLWTSDPNVYHGGAIKYDMDWVAFNWESGGCDLWEEISSTDFFWNRYSFRKGLVMASEFAKVAGDTKTSQLYESAGDAVKATLMTHYNGLYVYESTNRMKDASVICAFNDGYLEQDDLFSPTSEEVAGTISTLTENFCLQFPINRKDTENNVPGVLYGRYPGDIYAGGNPWVLTSAALAEQFYKGAIETISGNKKIPGKRWNKILGLSSSSSTTRQEIAKAFSDAGDSVLKRIKYHVSGNQFHLNEQIDKFTGFEKGAHDLTWSYATVLKACHFREIALDSLNGKK